jgi:hypothetical protein
VECECDRTRMTQFAEEVGASLSNCFWSNNKISS